MPLKICCFIFFICLSTVCSSQTNDTYYGAVITKIETGESGSDTTRFLYVRNMAGDRLAVYVAAGSVVSSATAYHLTAAGNGLRLHSRALLNDQQPTDSLRIDFQDETHTVFIGNQDHYSLFPTFYAGFKSKVAKNHSVMDLMNLLSDGLGDYPIAVVWPLLNFRPDLAKKIQQAKVITQRSQADIKDTWICRYFYNHSNKLDAMVARSNEEIRFTKKVLYRKNKSIGIRTYLNIESRQSTDRTIKYGPQERAPVTWRELYLETGKNRETKANVTLSWHDLGMLRNKEPTNAEILDLLRPETSHPYPTKHKD